MSDEKPVTAKPFLPERLSLPKLREAAASCKGCGLYRDATQTVFGEGSSRAVLMILGEKPGDKEDLSGKPFVGPAGALLEKALTEAGISRSKVYITNAVKHFKFVVRGKRRIHQKPKTIEIEACRPWLDAELAVVKPQVILCLGATAAQTLLGRSFKLTRHRGAFQAHESGAKVLATLHPSGILRLQTTEERAEAFEALVKDLRTVQKALKQ